MMSLQCFILIIELVAKNYERMSANDLLKIKNYVVNNFSESEKNEG